MWVKMNMSMLSTFFKYAKGHRLSRSACTESTGSRPTNVEITSSKKFNICRIC
jgi:hypothetical protein